MPSFCSVDICMYGCTSEPGMHELRAMKLLNSWVAITPKVNSLVKSALEEELVALFYLTQPHMWLF